MNEKKNFDNFNMDDLTQEVKTQEEKIREAATANAGKVIPKFDMTEKGNTSGDGQTTQDALRKLGEAGEGGYESQGNAGGGNRKANDDGMTDEQVAAYSKTQEEVQAMSEDERKKHNRIMTRQRKQRNANIRAEAAEFELSQNEIAILQQISGASRIVGYIMQNDTRVDISTRSTKDAKTGVTTSTYNAVNRAPSGRVATIVKMPKAAYERLSTGVAVDSTMSFSHAELQDLGLFAIPESKLADQVGMFFGAEIYEDEGITEKYVTRGKNPEPITSVDKLKIQNRKMEPKEGAPYWKFIPKFENRRVNVNNINYIPNRRMDLIPITGLTKEQADNLNQAAFYREECKRGKITNPNYAAVSNRKGGVDAAGVVATADGSITSKAFVAGSGTVPEFFAKVKHWYNRNDDGSDVILEANQILVPNRTATLTADKKLQVRVKDYRLDAADDSKSWDFNLAEQFPGIAAAISSVNGAMIDKDFIAKAIQSNRKQNTPKTASTADDVHVTLSLLRAKREDVKITGAGFQK